MGSKTIRGLDAVEAMAERLPSKTLGEYVAYVDFDCIFDKSFGDTIKRLCRFLVCYYFDVGDLFDFCEMFVFCHDLLNPIG